MTRKNIIACILTTTMLLSTITSCQKKEKETIPTNVIKAQVEEEAPWFTTTEFSIATEYSKDDYEYLCSNILGADEGGFIVETSAQLKPSVDYDWGTEDSSENSRYYIDYYGLDGTKINGVCVNSALSELENQEGYFGKSTYKDGILTVEYIVWTDSDVQTFNLDIDYANGTFGEWKDVTSYKSNLINKCPNGTYEGYDDLGDFRIDKYWTYSESTSLMSYELILTTADNQEVIYDLFELIPNTYINEMGTAYRISDTEVLLPAVGLTQYFFVINLETLEFSDKTSEFEWLSDVAAWEIKDMGDQGMFVFDYSDGALKIDFENKSIDAFMSFDECNVNRNKVVNMQVLSANDSSITIGGNVFKNYNDYNGIVTIIRFDKADANPNTGKALIKVASVSGYNDALFESIYQFNEVSSDCYLVVDDRYNALLGMEESGESYEAWQNAVKASTAEISTQMMVDILAGDGPDIIFNASNVAGLNSTDYLVDMSNLVGDSDKYLTNVTDSCKTGNYLYHVPLSVNISGISTTSSYVDDNQTGFTYEQYKKFVSEVCNGKDPLCYYVTSRVQYFELLHSSMFDAFFDGSSCNYNSDEFKELCEFVKNDVYMSDGDNVGDDYVIGWGDNINPIALYGEITSFSSFMTAYGDYLNEARILGVPSSDGRGPQLIINDSVAISCQANNIDGCLEYVQMLLGNDMQYYYSNSGLSTPINLEVLNEMCKDCIADYNAKVEINLMSFTAQELIEYSLPSVKVDDSAADYYINILKSCSGVVSIDPSICMIANEEIQAYFADQKTLDKVVEVINNRVTTVLQERG